MKYSCTRLFALLAVIQFGLGQTSSEEGHESGTGTLAPSPTESAAKVTVIIAPSIPVSTSLATTLTSDDDHENHTNEVHATHTDHEGTGTLAPSPTESVGCEAHGNHWHCDGPRETLAGTSTGVAATTSSSPQITDVTTNGGSLPGVLAFGVAPVAGIIGIALAI
ncbi:hypothetical protein H072_11278 [Dactylellina haptotyla CBS 200.50]|uniref:Uncharacterized protein n=1 Tax=Dactylellina haptotyla (strain CBS 200.50) TaxID=1284197 RepID=S8A2H1_DACHA|nr:hypothetical protein H072_11278 [Dactylellina haptotyla CBS 200.50]